MEGPVSEGRVIEMAVHCVDAKAGTEGLSDTTGYANPAQVKRMFPFSLSTGGSPEEESRTGDDVGMSWAVLRSGVRATGVVMV